jgi:hypothetical protein
MTPTTQLGSFPTALVDSGIDRDGARTEHEVSQARPSSASGNTVRRERAIAGCQNQSRQRTRGHCETSLTRRAARTVSKDELRAQVEKLERANAALRARSREATRAAKLSATRIAELEDEVARLRGQPPGTTDSHSAGSSNSGPQERDIDPGDAVPPGVAPEDPNPPDQEADIARENLEAHLRSE